MTDFVFVMIAKINQNRIWIAGELVKFFRIQVNAFVGDIERLVGQSVGQDLVAHLYFQFQEWKHFSGLFNSFIQTNTIQKLNGIQIVLKTNIIVGRNKAVEEPGEVFPFLKLKVK